METLFSFMFALIFFGIGFLNILVPEEMLALRDMFRIRGQREYTDLAIGMTRFGGVIAIIIGIVFLFQLGNF